jgi:molybdopterin molybdotransferase
MVEDTEPLGSERVRLLKGPLRPGQNIMRRAASLARGQTVLAAGKRLRAAEIGLLAEVGRPEVLVAGWPGVAIIATGDELVELSETPGPGQIRNSNGPLLTALALQAGAEATPLGIARDEPAALREKITAALQHDVVLLSGGVSAGMLDLVPGVLAALGVRPVLHKVNLKPGKPLWFGTRDREAGQPPALVFGLPGNPVSTLVCFELFVRPALERLSGLPGTGRPRFRARLAREHRHRGERPTYWPARWTGGRGGEGAQVEPLAWQGSGDLRTLTEANCLAVFQGPDRVLAEGEVVEVLALDRDSA